MSILSSYPYPQWTYLRYFSEGTEPYYVKKDPINVAWEDSQESHVSGQLEDEGWTWACGSTQYVYDGTWKSQDASKEDPDGYCLDPISRIHLRLWQLSNGDVIGGAHKEKYVGLINGGHEVLSFEDGENRVDDDFPYPFWYVASDSVWLNNFNSSPYNDGYATVITEM